MRDARGVPREELLHRELARDAAGLLVDHAVHELEEVVHVVDRLRIVDALAVGPASRRATLHARRAVDATEPPLADADAGIETRVATRRRGELATLERAVAADAGVRVERIDDGSGRPA